MNRNPDRCTGEAASRERLVIAERPRALVAEDDPGIRVMLWRILFHSGFEVDAVADGHAALEAVMTNDYTVIVLDLMMPRMDGFAVIADLQQRRPELLQRIIVTTASGEMDVQHVRPLVESFIEKPFDISGLLQTARSIVAQSTGRSRLAAEPLSR